METVRVAQQCHPSLGPLAQVRCTLRAQRHVPGRDNVISLIHDFVACIDIRQIALPSLRWRINPPEAEFVPTFDDARQTQCVVGHQFVAVSHTDSIGLMTCQRTEGQRACQKAVGDRSAKTAGLCKLGINMNSGTVTCQLRKCADRRCGNRTRPDPLRIRLHIRPPMLRPHSPQRHRHDTPAFPARNASHCASATATVDRPNEMTKGIPTHGNQLA